MVADYQCQKWTWEAWVVPEVTVVEGVEASEDPKEVTVARVAGVAVVASFYAVASEGIVGQGFLRHWAWNVYAAARTMTSIFDFAYSLSSCLGPVTFGCLVEAIVVFAAVATVVVVVALAAVAAAVVGDVAVVVAFEPFAVEYSFVLTTVRSYAYADLDCSPCGD